MKELLDTLAGWRREGVRVGRAMVIRTYGSAPRPDGVAQLYAEDGRIAGSISGGCVEDAAQVERLARVGHHAQQQVGARRSRPRTC